MVSCSFLLFYIDFISVWEQLAADQSDPWHKVVPSFCLILILYLFGNNLPLIRVIDCKLFLLSYIDFISVWEQLATDIRMMHGKLFLAFVLIY